MEKYKKKEWYVYNVTFFFICIYKLPSWNARQEHQFQVTFSEYTALELSSL